MVNKYIDEFKETPMYQWIQDSIHFNKEGVIDEKKLMNLKEREALKNFADIMASMWMKDGQIILKDISHWQRYLANNPKKPLDFYEYVERKYTNSENLSY